jgi:hypothetical protein
MLSLHQWHQAPAQSELGSGNQNMSVRSTELTETHKNREEPSGIREDERDIPHNIYGRCLHHQGHQDL